MKVVILCGGFGTRIRDVSENIPKPMVQIGGIPILLHIMNYYAHWGHKDFILCLGYRSEVIKDFFLNYRSNICDFTIRFGAEQCIGYHQLDRYRDLEDWSVTLAETGLKSMTGARVRKIYKYVSDESLFMLTYGDGLSDVNIDDLLKFHRSHGRIMTVTGVRPSGRFGELTNAEGGKVLEFNEKPQATGGWISGGYFVCDKRIFDYLPDNEDSVLETIPMQSLVRDGQMMVYEHHGFWQPMDTYREYMMLNELCNSGRPPWIIWD